MLCFTPTLVAPNFRHMETVISLETVVSNMQSSKMSMSEGYYSLLWRVLLIFFKAQLQILWVPRDFFFNFWDFFFFNCDVTTVTHDPNCVSHCLYTAFSHFRHFNATCAFLGRILQDAGVSACCWQLTHYYPLGWAVCLRWGLRWWWLTPNVTGGWQRPMACRAGGFWFYPLQRASSADPPAFLPIVTEPARPSSRHQSAEPRRTQGLRASFQYITCLNLGQRCICFIFDWKERLEFLNSALIIMSHSLDADFNSYDKNPPSSEFTMMLILRRFMVVQKTSCQASRFISKIQTSEMLK